MTKENEVAISIKLDFEWVTRLDALATRVGLSRHQLLKNMTEVGLDQIKWFSRLGFFQVGIMLRDILQPNPIEETGKADRAIPVYLREDVAARLEKFAEKGKLTKQQLLRNIVKVCIEEMEGYFRVGLGQAVIGVEKLKEKLGEAFNGIIKEGESAVDHVKGQHHQTR